MEVAGCLQKLIHVLPILLLSFGAAERSRPPAGSCTENEDVIDLCQRCAKLTRARSALASCCGDVAGGRGYCHDYVYFGQGLQPAVP